MIPKYLPIFNNRSIKHIILTSGRAGTKSSYAAIRSDYQLVSDANGSVVVLRKHHNKLRKTVYKEMLRGINRLEIPKSKFRITKSPMEITYKKFITAEEIAVIVPIPEAVLDDSEYDIWGEVKPRVTEAFGKVIDSAVLFGENKPSTWRDDVVATATKANAVITLGAADSLYDKIMAEDGVIAHVEDCGYFVNGHMADISMRAKLRGLKNANGDPLFKQDLQGSTQYALDGSPMNFPNNGAFDKSKALMISGDFSQLVYSIRQDITFKLFTEGVVQNTDGTIAYNLMQNDMVALRAVMRLGWEIPNPINSLKTDKTKRCPFAVLKSGE